MTKKKLNRELEQLQSTISEVTKLFKPPENLTVSEWADKYRRLSSENSAEAGRWRTARTPYLKDIMNAFTDSKIKRLTVVASSQVGKTELELNMMGYAIDVDPGPMMFIMPTLDTAQDFSKRRLAPMIRDTKPLRQKVSDIKSRDKNNTILKKSFPGGMLTITSSNSAASLAGTPARYVFGDERDRWALSAGTEGNPWELAEARTTTFYNSKMVEVSTPTIKGDSEIEKSFNLGTQERWCKQCPGCGEWHNITFNNIRFTHTAEKIKGKTNYTVNSVHWFCPSCGELFTEDEVRKQPSKWIAENPTAYANGHRSFWLNAFSSPWVRWESIVLSFLQAHKDPAKLQVVFNTKLGELWEDRGELADEDEMLARREVYSAELPDGVLVLTCGVDTQDNRLEYEVVGYGHYGENWGIKKGFIMGKPSDEYVWQRLDDIIDKTYYFQNGKGLNISMTFVDSGGHYTQEVYEACRKRFNKRVFPIKGRGGEGVPYVSPPSKIPIRDNKKITCWLYNIGVDAGKTKIFNSLKVEEAGANYCHFPSNENCGYDIEYFNGLLSEKLIKKKSGNSYKWVWEKLPGHTRNEPLDLRNYANAALSVLDPVMEVIEQKLRGGTVKQPSTKKQKSKKAKARKVDDW